MIQSGNRSYLETAKENPAYRNKRYAGCELWRRRNYGVIDNVAVIAVAPVVAVIRAVRLRVVASVVIT